MKVASAYISAVPQNEFYLVGYFNELREQPAYGVHDKPWCVGLLLEENNTRILFISLDVCMITKNKMEPIKKEIEKTIGVLAENIIINAIHSHSCPNGLDDSDIGNHDNEEYYEYIKNNCVKLSKELISKMQTVTAYIGECQINGYYGNRNNPDQPVDLTAYRIMFCDTNNKLIAQMLNLNCHSTVIGNQNMFLSTDLLGNVRQKLYERDKIMPYLINGASADISNRHFRQGNDFAELERVVSGVSKKLFEIKEYMPISFDGLSIREFFYPIYYDNTVNYPMLEKEKQKIEKQLTEPLSADEYKLKTSELLMVEVKLGYKEISRDVRCKIVTTKDIVFVTFPGELSNQFSTQLKRVAGNKKLIMICYADDYLGYFMNQGMYGKCYECTATYIPKGETEKIINDLEAYV